MFALQFVLPAIMLGIVGGFNFNFGETRRSGMSKYIGTWAIQSLITTISVGFIFWAMQPSIVAPYMTLFTMLFICWFLNGAILAARTDTIPSGAAIMLSGLIIIWLLVGMSGWAIFRSNDYHTLIGEVEEGNWTEEIAPVDEAHIRVVSQEQAQYLANKVLGESQDILGSRYNVGKVDVCNVNGQIVWTAPLQFRGFWKWNKYHTTPGYVLVSAEDNNRKPALVDTLSMRYVTSAYWGSNLNRYVYTHGYQGYQLRETSFELDDNYRPFFTISATKPTIGFSGPKTYVVIVVDPQTGEINEYEPGQAPSWIDRIIPEEIAESYMENWGKFVKGFWNTMFAEEDIIEPTSYPTGSDVWFVPDADGNNYWYTGMTSVSSEDQSLVGVMLMNTQTGVAKYYRLSGSNEQAIIDAVTQSLGADAQNWKPTQPIPYNIYGELSFVVPVIGIDKAILQKVAIVRASNLNVAIGNDKRSALRQYRRILSTNGNIVAPTHQSKIQGITGIIVRKGWELQDQMMVYSLLLDTEPSKLFSITSMTSAEIIIAREGDEVNLNFMQTDEEIVPVTSFDLIGIELRKSPIQSTYEIEVKANESRVRRLEQTRDDQRVLESLSPEDLRELMKLKQERDDNK